MLNHSLVRSIFGANSLEGSQRLHDRYMNSNGRIPPLLGLHDNRSLLTILNMLLRLPLSYEFPEKTFHIYWKLMHQVLLWEPSCRNAMKEAGIQSHFIHVLSALQKRITPLMMRNCWP